jgi:hypothetical protein
MKVKTGSIGRKAVLMVIAEHADKNGANSYPGHDTIAALTETYERKVREHIAALMAARIIKRERRFDSRTGYRLNDGYSLNMTAEDLPEVDVPIGEGVPVGGDVPNSTRGDGSLTAHGVTVDLTAHVVPRLTSQGCRAYQHTVCRYI